MEISINLTFLINEAFPYRSFNVCMKTMGTFLIPSLEHISFWWPINLNCICNFRRMIVITSVWKYAKEVFLETTSRPPVQNRVNKISNSFYHSKKSPNTALKIYLLIQFYQKLKQIILKYWRKIRI